MPIYTKTGDKGETGLPGKRRLPKTEPIFECLGSLDLTNALIGLAICKIEHTKEIELVTFLEQLQSDLLLIGSIIAAESPRKNPGLEDFPKRVGKMERQIDQWDKQLPELKNFILPSGVESAAIIHLARVSCRQAERNFHRLEASDNLMPVAIFLNRLSDYFFQSARYLNFRANKRDIIWKSNKQM